jgi:hypothetical protein
MLYLLKAVLILPVLLAAGIFMACGVGLGIIALTIDELTGGAL